MNLWEAMTRNLDNPVIDWDRQLDRAVYETTAFGINDVVVPVLDAKPNIPRYHRLDMVMRDAGNITVEVAERVRDAMFYLRITSKLYWSAVRKIRKVGAEKWLELVQPMVCALAEEDASVERFPEWDEPDFVEEYRWVPVKDESTLSREEDWFKQSSPKFQLSFGKIANLRTIEELSRWMQKNYESCCNGMSPKERAIFWSYYKAKKREFLKRRPNGKLHPDFVKGWQHFIAHPEKANAFLDWANAMRMEGRTTATAACVETLKMRVKSHLHSLWCKGECPFQRNKSSQKKRSAA